jgi:hypothetical protein
MPSVSNKPWPRRFLFPAILLFLTIISTVAVLPWGSVGHRFINGKSVYHLPGTMLLYIQDSTLFSQHANDADNRKGGDTSEGVKHYIDIDNYPDFTNLPQNFDSAVARYGLPKVWEEGILPWATLWCYDTLVARLKRADWNGAALAASDLGHYVGDGHMPLHATKNYDGPNGTKIGIHSRYESTMLNSTYYGNALAIVPDSVGYIADKQGTVFAYILHGNGLADSILHGDAYAKSLSGWSGTNPAPASYYNALWAYTGTMTLAQMQDATETLAAFWYSAWVDAGLLTPAAAPRAPITVVGDFRLEQNYPNPFNPVTTIRYTLPVGGRVRLSVYSMDGREVASLVNALQSAGDHEVQFRADDLASGMYVYALQLGPSVQARKLVVLR